MVQVHNHAVEEQGDGRCGSELLGVLQKLHFEMNLSYTYLSIGLFCTPAVCFGKLGEHEREYIAGSEIDFP